MTPAPRLQELIRTVQQDSASASPLDQLSAAATTAADMAEVGDALLGHFVDECRRAGCSWTEISGALGVTKQAAHKRFNLAAPTLERFTPRAKVALAEAQDAARRLGHNYIGTEHILLGVLAVPEGIAGRILAELGVAAETVEARLTAGNAEVMAAGKVAPMTPRAAEALGFCISEALTMGHNYIGTEHMLLALFRDPEALAARLLADFGIEKDAVRARVVEMLTNGPGGAPSRRNR